MGCCCCCGAAAGAVPVSFAFLSAADVSLSVAFPVGLEKLVAIHKTIKLIAKYQVAFSMKSVVFLIPITWLPPENPEAKPPPFEF